MADRYSRGAMVKAHEKSVVLGGGVVLFPVEPNHTANFASKIAAVIRDAETAAYEAGVRDTQRAVRKAIGARS